MIKKNNKTLITIYVVVLAVSLFGVLALNTKMLSIEDTNELDRIIDSKYLIKFGLQSPLQYDKCTFFFCMPTYNSLIDGAFGVAVLDLPIVLNNDIIVDMKSHMNSVNNNWREYASPNGLQIIENEFNVVLSQRIKDKMSKISNEGVFKDDLINKVGKNNYQLLDLIAIKQGIKDSASEMCEFSSMVIEDHEQSIVKTYDYIENTQENANVYINYRDQFCNIAESGLLVFRNGRYELDIPDITLFDTYNYDDDSGSVILIEPLSIIPREVTPDFERHVFKTSNIKLIFDDKFGDLVVGLGEQGIKEAEKIDGRIDFEQYAFQIEHANDVSSFYQDEFPWYTVVTNDQLIVDASEGKIEKITNLENLWLGLRTNRIPLFSTTNLSVILGSISVVSLLLIIFTIGILKR